MNLIAALLGFSFYLSVSQVSAQATGAPAEADLAVAEGVSFALTISDSWTFHYNPETKMYFIDLGSLREHVSQLTVLNSDEDLVFRDNLDTAPGNAIYELDLAQYPDGIYTVVLYTYHRVIEHLVHR